MLYNSDWVCYIYLYVIYMYICIYFSCSFQLQLITWYWIYFLVLCGRTLFIHSMCNSLYLLTPNSQTIPLAPNSPWQTSKSVLLCLWVCFCFADRFICVLENNPTLKESTVLKIIYAKVNSPLHLSVYPMAYLRQTILLSWF